MITSGTRGQSIVHDIPLIISVHIFCKEKPTHRQWSDMILKEILLNRAQRTTKV
jgi:hypothetical protein